MATKLKIVDEATLDAVTPPLDPPTFDAAPSRNTRGWSADRQRNFIERLALSGSVGEASAVAGVSSRSAYRLRN